MVVSSEESSSLLSSSETVSSSEESSNIVSSSEEASNVVSSSEEVSSVVSSSSEDISSVTPSSSEEVSSEEPVVGTTFYFIDSSWWNNAAASSYIYVWDSTKEIDNYKVAFPGEKMTHIKWDSDSKTNIWSYVINLESYDSCLITRRSGDGESDWGARTEDIHLTNEFNTIVLSDEAKWFGDGNKASVTFDSTVVEL